MSKIWPNKNSPTFRAGRRPIMALLGVGITYRVRLPLSDYCTSSPTHQLSLYLSGVSSCTHSPVRAHPPSLMSHLHEGETDAPTDGESVRLQACHACAPRPVSIQPVPE